jgi:hypothetical protein
LYSIYSYYNEEYYLDKNGKRLEFKQETKDNFNSFIIDYDLINKYYRTYEKLKDNYLEDKQTFYFIFSGSIILLFSVIFILL